MEQYLDSLESAVEYRTYLVLFCQVTESHFYIELDFVMRKVNVWFNDLSVEYD